MDVIISNCVINLSADKDRVLREAFRVLKPGGRFAVSDVVVRGAMPPEMRKHAAVGRLYRGRAGRRRISSKLARAGFEDIEVEPTRVYRVEDARAFLSGQGIDVDAIAPQMDGKFMSAFIRAIKPRSGCCNDGGPRIRGGSAWDGVAACRRRRFGHHGRAFGGGNVAIALLANTVATGAHWSRSF